MKLRAVALSVICAIVTLSAIPSYASINVNDVQAQLDRKGRKHKVIPAETDRRGRKHKLIDTDI